MANGDEIDVPRLRALADVWDSRAEHLPPGYSLFEAERRVYEHCAIELRLALGWLPRD